MQTHKDDKEDIEYLSLCICAICGRRLFSDDEKYKIADQVLCSYCNCGVD